MVNSMIYAFAQFHAVGGKTFSDWVEIDSTVRCNLREINLTSRVHGSCFALTL